MGWEMGASVNRAFFIYNEAVFSVFDVFSNEGESSEFQEGRILEESVFFSWKFLSLDT